jgi:hypothetical protein
MKRVALFLVLLWPLSAAGADENYRAQLQDQARTSRPFTIHGGGWICQSIFCRSSQRANAPDEAICKALARAQGPLVAFAHGKRTFDKNEIFLCNKLAADAKADDQKSTKADLDDSPPGESTTQDKTPDKGRVKKPKAFGTFRTEGLTVTGTGASAPPRKFPPVHIAADGFEVHGTGAGAKRPPFPPRAWRTETLTVTGTAPLSESFGTFRTSGLHVTGTGESAPRVPFAPVRIRTDPLVVTGTGAGAKRPPFPSLAWRTEPFAVTGTAPLREPFGTFRTSGLRVTGTGESTSRVVFAPVSIRTESLVVTGTGAGAKRPPFSPLTWRTDTFAVTGTAALSEPFGTFRTGAVRVTGTGESGRRAKVPPVSFRTGPLAVTGTGESRVRPPFTPVEIRTVPFRITGAAR